MGGESFLVAEDAIDLIGFCSFKGNEVIGLYVAPRVALKGFGSALLAQAEAVIVAGGATEVRLVAALSSLAFYRKRGYREVRRKPWKTRGGLVIEVWDMLKSFDVHAQ